MASKEALAAFCGAALLSCCQPAFADLNKYEAEAGLISISQSYSLQGSSAYFVLNSFTMALSDLRGGVNRFAKDTANTSASFVGGEFGIGSALQYGEADIKGKDFHGQVSLCHFSASEFH